MGKLADFKEPLPDAQCLDELCRHIRPDKIVTHLYGCIMEKLDVAEEIPRSTPLRDYLIAYLEEKDEESHHFELVNENILVVHALACFTYIVSRKRTM